MGILIFGLPVGLFFLALISCSPTDNETDPNDTDYVVETSPHNENE